MLARWLRRLLLLQVVLFALLSLSISAAFGLGNTTAAALFVVLIITANSIPPIVASVVALPPVAWRHEPSTPTLWQLFRSALVEWPVFVALFTLIQPFPNLWLPARKIHLPAGERNLVVLVHGYCCNHGLWCWLAPRLREHGLGVATVDLEPPLAGIEELADAFASQIDDIVRKQDADKVVIVAHSMGGLVARIFLRQVERPAIVKLIPARQRDSSCDRALRRSSSQEG